MWWASKENDNQREKAYTPQLRLPGEAARFLEESQVKPR
jgi:hypothetical protein